MRILGNEVYASDMQNRIYCDKGVLRAVLLTIHPVNV